MCLLINDRKNRKRCKKAKVQQPLFELILPAILKSNQCLMHTILFVFKRDSRGYLARLNRSSVEKVMAILRTVRSAVKADGNLGENSRKKINYYIVKPNLSHILKATKINLFPAYKYL